MNKRESCDPIGSPGCLRQRIHLQLRSSPLPSQTLLPPQELLKLLHRTKKNPLTVLIKDVIKAKWPIRNDSIVPSSVKVLGVKKIHK